MRVLTAVLAVCASLPAFADESSPMLWWSVAATPINYDLPGDSVEIRTVAEAREAFTWKVGEKTLTAPIAGQVDFEKWMIVMIKCTGNSGSSWDVKKATWEGKTPTIEVIGTINPDGNEAYEQCVLLVLIPTSKEMVKIVHRNSLELGAVAAMQKERDCGCTPTDVKPLAADCPVCKKEGASGRGLKWCPDCAKARQACPSCGLRIAGQPPLKEEVEKK